MPCLLNATICNNFLELVHSVAFSRVRVNEPVIFSHRVHLKLGNRFHALLQVCSDRDNSVPLITCIEENPHDETHCLILVFLNICTNERKKMINNSSRLDQRSIMAVAINVFFFA